MVGPVNSGRVFGPVRPVGKARLSGDSAGQKQIVRMARRDGTDEQTLDDETAAKAAEALRRIMELTGARSNSRLRIELDPNTGTPVYMTVDKMTGEVLDLWPHEEILRFVRFLRDFKGLQYDQSV
jgi:uncharacterized FlaG/YvyC family protein